MMRSGIRLPQEDVLRGMTRKPAMRDPLTEAEPVIVDPVEDQVKDEQLTDTQKTAEEIKKLTADQNVQKVTKDDLRQQALAQLLGGVGASVTRIAGAFGGQNVEKAAQAIEGQGAEIGQDIKQRRDLIAGIEKQKEGLLPRMEASNSTKTILSSLVRSKSGGKQINIPQSLSQQEADKLMGAIKSLPDNQFDIRFEDTAEGVQMITVDKNTGETKQTKIGSLSPKAASVAGGKPASINEVSSLISAYDVQINNPNLPENVKAIYRNRKQALQGKLDKGEGLTHEEVLSETQVLRQGGGSASTQALPSSTRTEIATQEALGKQLTDQVTKGEKLLKTQHPAMAKFQWLDNARSTLNTWTGMLDQDTSPEANAIREYIQETANLTADQLHAKYGAVLSAAEMERADAFLPKKGDSLQQIINKQRSMANFIQAAMEAKKKSLGGMGYNVPGQQQPQQPAATSDIPALQPGQKLQRKGSAWRIVDKSGKVVAQGGQ